MQQLIKTVQKLIDVESGTWGIDFADLQTGEIWEYNAELRFTAASIIKVPIMVATYQAHEDNLFRFSDEMILKKDDQVGGAGVLQYMTPGTRLTIHDVMTLMIIQSDNTATNMLMDRLGINYIQSVIKKAELRESIITNKLMIVSNTRKGPNQVSAGDMTKLLTNIVHGKVVSEYACIQMINILKKQQLNNLLPGKLPGTDTALIGATPKWSLAHKTGSLTNILHDVGIFYVGQQTFVASVLSQDIDESLAQETLMEIGAVIYDYLINQNPDLTHENNINQ